MAFGNRTVWVYQQLADWYDGQGQVHLRDRFLVLAADTALAAGDRDAAEQLRSRLLQLNPHHLLRPFASFAEAVESGDVQDYVLDLRQKYPAEVADQLLESLHTGQAGRRPTSKVPPTKVAADGGTAPAEPRASGGEPLKVYRVQEPAEEPERPPLARSAPPRPPRPVPPAPARPQARPPAPPSAAAGSRRHVQPRSPYSPGSKAAPVPRPEDDASEPTRGGWVATLLFVLVLALGLGLAGYTLLGPFLRTP